MYPPILTNSLQLNVEYFTSLLAILSELSPENFENHFDMSDPASFNDVLQAIFIKWLINSWMIIVNKTSEWTKVKIRWGLITPLV